MAAKKTGAPIPATVPLGKLPLVLGAVVVGADTGVVGDVGVGVEGVVGGEGIMVGDEVVEPGDDEEVEDAAAAAPVVVKGAMLKPLTFMPRRVRATASTVVLAVNHPLEKD
jgi:hypothetical protein